MTLLRKPRWRYWKAVTINVKEQTGNFAIRVKQQECGWRKKTLQRVYLTGEYTGVYFSRRESECLNLLTLGYTIKRVAETLTLSTRTVEFYIKNMKKKLNCRTRSELIGIVMCHGFRQNYEKTFSTTSL